MPTIALIGTFDTKAKEFAFLRECLIAQGAEVIAINAGAQGDTDLFKVDYPAILVAQASGENLKSILRLGNRSEIIDKMAEGAANILGELYSKNEIQGAIGMGGGGGTFISLKAMQSLPVGFPKVVVSTVATKDLSQQVGAKDIVLIPSLVDIAGLNRISRTIFQQASGSLMGMVNTEVDVKTDSSGTIAISMFGNTTKCVEYCIPMLEKEGFEVLVFHAVGAGGRTMESLIREGLIDGVLDLTTTELADQLCEGICSAGPGRLTAASDMGIAQVVVPGCLDMVNYGSMDSVPEKYRDRHLYSWAPDVTLMRTNPQENRLLAQEMAIKLRKSNGPVQVLIPSLGISILSREGDEFFNQESDLALFSTLKSELKGIIDVKEFSTHINDKSFAEAAVNSLLSLM